MGPYLSLLTRLFFMVALFSLIVYLMPIFQTSKLGLSQFYKPIHLNYSGEEQSTFENASADDAMTFEDFDNEKGADHFIVPNIIHYIRFNRTDITFVEYVAMQSVMHNHHPDQIFIHTNIPDGNFTGKYWDWIKQDGEMWSRIRILPLQVPSEIFGQELSKKWRISHGGDVARLRTMMKYGGIYLDNDVYVVHSLDKYRKFEMTLNWDRGEYLGNQIIIAHKNARMLKMWFECFRRYYPDDWFYNAAERPTELILDHQPELIHRIQDVFAVKVRSLMRIYLEEGFNWRQWDAVHLLINHRHYMDNGYNDTPIFNEETIRTYKFPFGDMVREILDAHPEIKLYKN